MLTLRKQTFTPPQTKSIGALGASAKRVVPELTAAQTAFYGGLGKTSAFSLETKSKPVLSSEKTAARA
jgi:hypothetical protein